MYGIIHRHCNTPSTKVVVIKLIVGVIAEFGEKGGKGISVGEELNIIASEFVVFFEHATTSKLPGHTVDYCNMSLCAW